LLAIFLDKPAQLSSEYQNLKANRSFQAAMAVDGIYEPSDPFASLASSIRENRPWWRVDLEDVHCVWAVNILNRYTSKRNHLIGIKFSHLL